MTPRAARTAQLEGRVADVAQTIGHGTGQADPGAVMGGERYLSGTGAY